MSPESIHLCRIFSILLRSYYTVFVAGISIIVHHLLLFFFSPANVSLGNSAVKNIFFTVGLLA